MPSIQKGSFHMVDHLVRVHPEQTVKVDGLKRVPTKVPPLQEFVRVIATAVRGKAEAAGTRRGKGDAFFQVAREVSKDPSAPVGGYLGAVRLESLDPRIAQAAAAVSFGEFSKPIDLGDHWIIIESLPRDFKNQAGLLYDQARLKNERRLKGALQKYQQALVLYPNFLRAFIGRYVWTAWSSTPALFGASPFSANSVPSLVLDQAGNKTGAKQALALATKIDPRIGQRRKN